MKTIKRIGVTLFVILLLSVSICYAGYRVKDYLKGVEFASQGKFKEAKSELEKVLKDAPNRIDLNVIEDVLEQKINSETAIHIFKGIAFRQKKLFDESIGEFNKAVGFNSKYAFTYFFRGRTYLSKGQYDRAISDFSRAIEIDPKFAIAYNIRGYAYADKGQHDKAISDFSRAIEIEPKYTDAYLNRGDAYADKGECGQAISDASKAIGINPKNAIAYNSRGIIYRKKGQYDEAISDYSKAIEIWPKYTDAYLNRGNAYADKGEHGQAISDYSKVIEINPKDYLAYNNRGIIYSKKGQYDKAISDYSKAIEINPKRADAYDGMDIALNAQIRKMHRSEELFLLFWQICFAIAFFSGVLKGREVFGFILGIAGPLGAIVVLCIPSTIKRCVACKNNIPKKAIKCPHCQTDQPEKLILEKELPVKIKVIKWILLLVPIFLWLLTVGSCIYKQYRTFPLVKEANGLIWGGNLDTLIVRVEYNDHKKIRVKHRYRILVEKSDGMLVYESEMVIDNDKWDSGFVKAVNVDDDAELEILAWDTYKESKSFYLDYIDGIVQKKSFFQISTEVKASARELPNAQLAKEIPLFLLFPLFVYYIFFGIVSLVVRLWHRSRRSKALKYKNQLA